MEKVTSIPLNNLYAWQQVGLMRLMMYLTGRVHEIIGDFSNSARVLILANAGEDGSMDTAAAYRTQVEISKAWGDTFTSLETLIGLGLREGASLPFGVQAAYHEKLIVPALKTRLSEATVAEGVFDAQLRWIIDAAMRLAGPDGLQFSSRLWRLDRDTREGMSTAIMQAVVDKKSAWQLAKDLEQFLGAGKDCPKWTYTRLNVVSSIDKAKGDLSGLLSGDDCAGKGVSYNALRLARTEIQRTHHLANDNRMAAMPWIEQERIVLSGSHPKPDICDDVVHGGENSDGVYPKGTIILPLHPHCFCDKRAVQDLNSFGDQLAGWVRSGQGFPGMDQYAASLGSDLGNSLLESPIAQAFGVWCFDKFDEISARMQ
ncbi:MAG TPA: hypothetical protein DCG54_07615 [Anaerolineae bacterium]|jgi:hypothetical protein|nr:hypothetical protein [Anaerolineae bacterium]